MKRALTLIIMLTSLCAHISTAQAEVVSTYFNSVTHQEEPVKCFDNGNGFNIALRMIDCNLKQVPTMYIRTEELPQFREALTQVMHKFHEYDSIASAHGITNMHKYMEDISFPMSLIMYDGSIVVPRRIEISFWTLPPKGKRLLEIRYLATDTYDIYTVNSEFAFSSEEDFRQMLRALDNQVVERFIQRQQLFK